MTLAMAVDRAFVATTGLSGAGEIKLFPGFMDAYVSVGGPGIVEEYHGPRSQVCFHGRGKHWGRGADAQCELADLLVVSLLSGGAEPRATFLQAKYEKRAPLGFCCPVEFKDYVANMEQWDLLARRPKIRRANKRFVPPSDLLSGATLASVGSFGFFYRNDAGEPQLQYVSADALKPKQDYAKRGGKLKRIGSGCVDRRQGGYTEAVARCCTVELVSALDRGLIGTPLTTGSSVARHVRSVAASLAQPGPLATQLLTELDAAEARAVDGSESFGARSLLIVRGDGAEL